MTIANMRINLDLDKSRRCLLVVYIEFGILLNQKSIFFLLAAGSTFHGVLVCVLSQLHFPSSKQKFVFNPMLMSQHISIFKQLQWAKYEHVFWYTEGMSISHDSSFDKQTHFLGREASLDFLLVIDFQGVNWSLVIVSLCWRSSQAREKLSTSITTYWRHDLYYLGGLLYSGTRLHLT